MKLTTLALILVAATSLSVKALTIRAAPDARNLEIEEDFDYAFLVSQIRQNQEWCLTAVEGTAEFGNLGLLPCDFNDMPAAQLWAYGIDGKVHSGLEETKCVVLGFGTELFNGVHARLADCSLETDLNSFLWDEENSQLIVDYDGDDDYCITNRGPHPHTSDIIHAKPCIDRKDFKWTPRNPTYFFVGNEYGCIEPKNGETSDGKLLILGSCLPERAWRVEFFEGSMIFHSRLDDGMCMQAGQGGVVESGTLMRLKPCDKNPKQLFEWGSLDDPIRPTGNASLCATYRGLTPNVGIDPIIMIICDEDRDIEWSGEPVDSP